MKIKKNEITTCFELTGDSDTSLAFFPVSIYEFSLSMAKSYDVFSKNVTYEYFIKETDGQNGSLLSTEPSKFKGLQANNFDYTKNGDSVEIITVNGISKYYMLVNYLFRSNKKIATNIFSSIIISK